MLTVAETETFTRLVGDYWSEPERLEFIEHIASHPELGDVVPGSGGVRKIRWHAKGKGKRGGVRVIYYNMLSVGTIWLLLIYGKNEQENIPVNILRKIKEELENEG
ncbi:MAG: DNA-binding protein [Mariprofundaceae bacterium]|nr:DNA-binding protein [Mariprofundaceae bacterium]